MAQSVAYFAGFETGDASELNSLAAGHSISTSTVRTGGYSLSTVNTTRSTLVTGLGATQAVFRAYLNIAAFAGSGTIVLVDENNATTSRLRVRINTAGNIGVIDSGVTLGLTTTTGTIVAPIGSWFRLEVVLDLAAGGVVKTYINGVLDVNTTHSSDVSATVTDSFGVASSPAISAFFDDVRIDKGGLALIGAGQIIARQGIAGTSTYNAWTKNGAATAALCWSDTPFSTATNCSDSVLADAQTMLVGLFSTDPGRSVEGTQVIGTSDTINACKVAVIAKTAVAGNMDIRRRVGGIDTNVTKTLTTADAYYETGYFTDTPANLDAYEIGVANDLVGTAETVEDMWLMVDYTPPAPIVLPFRNLYGPPQPASRIPLQNANYSPPLQLVGTDKLPFRNLYGLPKPRPEDKHLINVNRGFDLLLLTGKDLLPFRNLYGPPKETLGKQQAFNFPGGMILLGKDQLPFRNFFPSPKPRPIDPPAWWPFNNLLMNTLATVTVQMPFSMPMYMFKRLPDPIPLISWQAPLDTSTLIGNGSWYPWIRRRRRS